MPGDLEGEEGGRRGGGGGGKEEEEGRRASAAARQDSSHTAVQSHPAHPLTGVALSPEQE